MQGIIAKHCMKLLKKNDEQKIIETAHKMIPMLKQLEAGHIVDILDTLEDRIYSGNYEKIKSQVAIACDQMDELVSSLKQEIA